MLGPSGTEKTSASKRDRELKIISESDNKFLGQEREKRDEIDYNLVS